MIFILKILISALCGWLNYKGGKDWLPARRFIMPAVIALYCAIAVKTWWLFFALGIPMGLMLSLSNDIRWLYCLRVALASAGLFICGAIGWVWYIIYAALCTASGFTSSWPQKYTDPITGMAFSILVWLV